MRRGKAMTALPAPPAIGDTVRVPVRVRRSWQMTTGTVRGIAPHSVLVAVNGKCRHVPPAEVAR